LFLGKVRVRLIWGLDLSEESHETTVNSAYIEAPHFKIGREGKGSGKGGVKIAGTEH
jgi:hypothetical protein